MQASQLDGQDTWVPGDPSDVPIHEDDQEELELSQQLENSKISTPSTTTACPNPELPQRQNIPALCKVNPLGQVPTRIKGGTSVFENLSLFFAYRVQVSGIEWSDLDTIVSNSENDSESDVLYEYQSEETDEDAEGSNPDLGGEKSNDGKELEQSEEVLEPPIAGISGHKREPKGVMRVLGPTEITGLLRRVLYRLSSENIVCLDEIQTLISKRDGDELREAVGNSLSPFFDECILGKNLQTHCQVGCPVTTTD